MNLILNAIEANFDFRDVTDRLPLLRFMEHSSQRRQSAVGFRVGAGNFNCSVKSRSVCRGQTGSPEVNDHLRRDISQFTFAPGLYLPSHRFKVALHPIDPDRNGVIRLSAEGYTTMSNGASGRKNMPSLEMDRLATEAMQCWADFQEGLSSDKQKYPLPQFRAFWAVTKRYAELTRSDPLIHRSVAGAVNGLVDFLEAERKCVPGVVLRDAERLECLLFSGYDPHFEGDEPPGL